MRTNTLHSAQRGAALIIGLILLAIITLLAVVGMNIANSELASATSEQIRLRAFQTAESGLEHGLVDMRTAGTTGPAIAGIKVGPTAAAGSPKDQDDNAIDKYTTVTTFHGTSVAAGFGAKDFAAFHYTIESTGQSSRGATANHEMGAYLVSNYQNNDFTALPVATP